MFDYIICDNRNYGIPVRTSLLDNEPAEEYDSRVYELAGKHIPSNAFGVFYFNHHSTSVAVRVYKNKEDAKCRNPEAAKTLTDFHKLAAVVPVVFEGLKPPSSLAMMERGIGIAVDDGMTLIRPPKEDVRVEDLLTEETSAG